MRHATKQHVLSTVWALMAGLAVGAGGYGQFGEAAIGAAIAVTILGLLLAWIEYRLTELVEVNRSSP